MLPGITRWDYHLESGSAPLPDIKRGVSPYRCFHSHGLPLSWFHQGLELSYHCCSGMFLPLFPGGSNSPTVFLFSNPKIETQFLSLQYSTCSTDVNDLVSFPVSPGSCCSMSVDPDKHSSLGYPRPDGIFPKADEESLPSFQSRTNMSWAFNLVAPGNKLRECRMPSLTVWVCLCL